MSAIWGCLSKSKHIDIKSIIEKSSLYITRHGNDKLKFWNNEIIAFAHKQLYTTYESLRETQPFSDIESKLSITADARIDNRRDLISLLQSNNTITDVELIILSYKKWGIQCVDYIIGDFSFAIWDENKKRLFCARDRLGIKPFFYKDDETGFYFASEVLPLTKLSHTSIKPNINAMKKFANGAPGIGIGCTMYQDIFSLPPGNILLIEDNELSIDRYWFPETISINHDITFEQAVKTFYTLFKEAVRCRLRSAFPIGFELSGGVDSSSVVCMADTIPSRQSKTAFINRFGSYKCDEGIYSTEVENTVKMACISLDADKIDYSHNYSMYFNYTMSPDWPIFATFTQKFPMAKAMKKKDIRVVLTGQGGDQVLTGNYFMLADYMKSFQWIKFISLWRSIHYHKKDIFKQTIYNPLIPKYYKNKISGLFSYLRLKKENFTVQSKDNNPIDYSVYPLAQHSDLQDIIGEAHNHFVDNNAYHCAGTYNIEFRHPFYDSRLIEFSLSLPAEYKLWGDQGKKILREAMKGILPEKIRIRQDKAEMSELICNQIAAIDLDGFWQKKHIVNLGIIEHDDLMNTINIYKSSDSSRGTGKLWRLINLEYWYRINFVIN